MSERRSLRVTSEARDPLDTVTEELLDAYLDPSAHEMQHIGSYELPSDAQVERVVEMCRALLFPGYAGPAVARVAERPLREQALGRNDLECADCTHRATGITDRFMAHLPSLRAQISADLHAAYESDPAASGVDEILLPYPGSYAITVYRIAHALLREGAVSIPRMLTELAHRRSGFDFDPGVVIGVPFFVDHGSGVVIGESTLIGMGVL